MFHYSFPGPKAYQFDPIVQCGTEIAVWLSNHDNWGDPVIETPILCRPVVWEPAEFSDRGSRWKCLDN